MSSTVRGPVRSVCILCMSCFSDPPPQPFLTSCLTPLEFSSTGHVLIASVVPAGQRGSGDPQCQAR